jgi:hypothetical protein
MKRAFLLRKNQLCLLKLGHTVKKAMRHKKLSFFFKEMIETESYDIAIKMWPKTGKALRRGWHLGISGILSTYCNVCIRNSKGRRVTL